MISSSRLKREDCPRTKHDSVFSNWKVLIGPSHWEDYSLGKDGVERYMIYNLPAGSSCPGLYELGVAAIPDNEGLRSRKHTSHKKIIVVYLGEADNVRTRLQHYGRAGSHLDHGSKIKTSGVQRGPGLFKEVFSRGYSIMFRWAPMTSKKEAEKMEAQLLGVFDYAWNTRGNGFCRREDILFKLDNVVRSPIRAVLGDFRRWKHRKFSKKVGIKISTSWPLAELGSPNNSSSFRLPHIFKFSKSRPRLVPGEDSSNILIACGVAMGDGSVCKNRPVDGRKRCIEHKGKKISGTKFVPTKKPETTEGQTSVCGVLLLDGSCCMELTDYGKMRCELHRGRRISSTKHDELESKLLDLLETAVQIPCSQLVQRDISPAKEHDIGGSFSSSIPISEGQLSEMHEGPGLSIGEENRIGEGTNNLNYCNICGVVTADGYVCRRVPLSGRKRCEDHKGIKKTRRVDLVIIRNSLWRNFDNQSAA